jgi:hypothetical protein
MKMSRFVKLETKIERWKYHEQTHHTGDKSCEYWRGYVSALQQEHILTQGQYSRLLSRLYWINQSENRIGCEE